MSEELLLDEITRIVYREGSGLVGCGEKKAREILAKVKPIIVKEIKKLVLQAIADEPEFPGDMPDELWKEINGDRGITQRVMQNTVRITKRDITDRFQQSLKEEK